MNQSKNQTLGECCPIFNVEKWDGKIFFWDEKPFLLSSIPTLFHIPFPPMIGKKLTKMMAKAEEAHQIEENKEDVLVLFTDPTPFKSEIYLGVTGEVSDAKNTTISGTFMTKVFEGNYNDIPKFIKEMDVYLNEKNKKAKKYYVHYAYCPKCAKEAGHNYILLFAKI